MSTTVTGSRLDIVARAEELRVRFAERAAEYDVDGRFVEENYQDLKEHRFLAGLVPVELGGEGVLHSEMCEALRIIGGACGSTALALSMHQHLVAASVWKYRRGQGGEAMLQKVADSQPVFVSTGANDWLASSGEMVKTEGGYLVSGAKHFASQSAVGDVMVTSAAYNHPEEGWQVLHFPLPMNSEGITVLNNWDTMGMRGTGSHSIRLENVFVPEQSIALARKRGDYHPVWNVVLGVAMPLIMSTYVGIAERAAALAVASVRDASSPRSYSTSAIGELNNVLTTARLNWKDMIRISDDYGFDPVDSVGHEILTRKTNTANAAIEVVTRAMDIVGGSGYFRAKEMERLFRDVQAAKYHPLQRSEQIEFSGNFLLKSV